MSRYGHTVQRDGKTLQVAYGFDNPCQEYFIHVYDDKDEPIFAVASQNTLTPHPDYPNRLRWSNSELLELFREWEVPKEYVMQLVLDLPF